MYSYTTYALNTCEFYPVLGEVMREIKVACKGETHGYPICCARKNLTCQVSESSLLSTKHSSPSFRLTCIMRKQMKILFQYDIINSSMNI